MALSVATHPTRPHHIAQIRSTEMNSMQEALSRLRQAELLRDAEDQRLAHSLHRAQRLQRRAMRASRRADRASRQAGLALVRAS
jgi:hypothetical protein